MIFLKNLGSDALRRRVVSDGPRITCAGAMSAFDMTRDLIRHHLGNAMALDVDALFLRDDPTTPTPRRYDQARPTSVQRAIALMHENIDNPLSLAHISQHTSPARPKPWHAGFVKRWEPPQDRSIAISD